jgi:long-subunit fatty acid transport protein
MKSIIAVSALLACATAAAAQDQQLGARTKAMGGSYTAFEDDPVSVWLNPAGISTQPDQMAIAYQTYTAYPVTSGRGPNDTTTFSVKPETVLSDPAIIPSFIGFVFQAGSADDPMAIGFCFARPYHLNYAMDQIVSPSQTSFSPRNEMEQSLNRFRVAFAKDFRILKPGEAGFFTHVSAGLGLDVGFERWEFRSPSGTRSDTAASMGFGAGLLVGVYDDTEAFKVNFGFAYQSPIEYNFGVEPTLLPAFDMPQQINLGLTFYALEGQPLRVTLDLQFIDWKRTAAKPLLDNQPTFENVTNFSIGVEYRIKLNEKWNLYPRLGFRRFDAPWADKDNLPVTGQYKLVLDTKGDVFNIVTFGVGLSWTNEQGRVRSVDIAGDAGGDASNVALSFTYEF